MDEVPLKLTMLSDSSTQLLYFCHSFSLSIGIYMSSAQHSSAHKGLILSANIDKCLYVCISEELRQFTGFCAACCMALSHVHWQHSSTCYGHAPLILNNGSENSGEISYTCFSQIGVNTT